MRAASTHGLRDYDKHRDRPLAPCETTVPCPTCFCAPGARCLTYRGHVPASPHLTRQREHHLKMYYERR